MLIPPRSRIVTGTFDGAVVARRGGHRDTAHQFGDYTPAVEIPAPVDTSEPSKAAYAPGWKCIVAASSTSGVRAFMGREQSYQPQLSCGSTQPCHPPGYHYTTFVT